MVPYLDVQHLTKSFGALQLFNDISFSIGEGQKVGLIAKNGTGKSTLLSILSGKEGYDSGSIVFRNDLKVGMLEQTPKFDPEESVLDACFNHEGDPEKVLKAKQVLTQLKIRDLSQPMGQLSGGQQKRVALANVLLTEPDLLILDEPTNHLDLEMIEWLEGFLARGNRTLLMVTHDRFFLDRVCSVILELDDHTIYTYRGNYAYYLEKRQERIDNRSWRSVRSASTTAGQRWHVPTTCIVRSWNGCVVSRRLVAIRPAIGRRRSTSWRRWRSNAWRSVS